MAFTINTNIASMQAQEYLRVTQEFQTKTISRVTSGLRIVSSGDDAAGLAIANGFRSDQAVLTQGIRNANDGLATLQTIDSGINNISKLLDRARTLATQSASGTFNGNREVLNSEFQSVIEEINRQ
ncbi:MAG: flagellin, partial [Bryobacteraceae bacterium]